MNSRVSRKRLGRALWLGLLAVALAPLARAQAPAVAVASRITAAVNENNRVTLRGNTHPLARPQFDQGAVADSQPIQRALLLLRRSPEQEAALRSLLDQQQSKSSPNYRQWLTPQQFGQQFGPSDTDVQTVTNWLESHGFQVNRVSAGRTVIEFSGNAGQVRDAFGAEIHRFAVNGQQHLANAADLQIPAALAPVVAGTVSLNDFGRKALHKVGGFIAASPRTNGAKPAFTGQCSGPNGAFTCYVVAPYDFATIYNSLALWTSVAPVPAGIDGTGQTIAIVGDSNINCADVTNFRTLFDLPVSNPNDCTQATSNVQVILDGPDPGITPDEIEADLDVEWSGAVAKGAHVDFVASENTDVSAGVDLSAEYIIDNNLAPVMSESFGDCEANLGSGGSEFYSVLWEQAAAQGITVMVSTGDSGAAGCDDDNAVLFSSNGLAVSGLASTPFNVAVGGTDFNDAGTQSTYWNAANNNNATTKQSVMGYVPEIPWDDSCAASSVTGCNGVAISGAPPSLNIVGGGGGQSTFVAKPAWQSGKAVPLSVSMDGSRDLPDVSLFAAAGSGSNSFYPICELDVPGNHGLCTNGSFIGVGGTSSSAPAFAGIMAMVNQYMVAESMPARQGNANYVLYSLASSQVNAGTSCNSTSSPNTASTTGCTFYDVTIGSNSVPCVTGTGCTIQNVNANVPGVLEKPSGTLAWQAGSGYDLSTGLGSVNAFNLVHNWPAAVGLFKPTNTTLQLCTGGSPSLGCSSSSISIVHGATVYVDAFVSPNPGPGTATGDAALIGTPNTTSNNGGSTTVAADRFSASAGGNVDIYPLSSGSTSGEFTKFLVGGSYSLTAHYTGDGTFGASDSSPAVSVNITPEGSTTTVSTAGIDPNTGSGSFSSSAPYGFVDLIRVDVVGSSGEETATGNVAITDNGAAFGGAGCCALNSDGQLDLEPGVNLIPTLSTVTHKFVASFAGDASYAPSASSSAPPLSFTVTPAPTPIVVTAMPTTVASGGNVTLTATVSPDSIGVAPSGMVTFFANGIAIPGGVNYARTNGSLFGAPGTGTGGVFAGVVATLNYQPAASTTITAMYVAGADPNYMSSALSSGVALTVTNAFSFSSANNSDANAVVIAAPGGAGTSTITVTSLNSFAGTVTMTCSVAPTVGVTDEPTCSFPGGNSVMLTANGMQMPTVMLSTTASTLLLPESPTGRPGPMGLPFPMRPPLAWIVATILAVLTLVFLPRVPERRRGYAWLAVLLLLVMIAAVACSSHGSVGGTSPNSGTTTGFYAVTVSGTSGTTTGTAGTAVFDLQ